jgi:hypothetical protein
MLKNYEPDRNMEDLSDAEINAAIGYLDRDSLPRNKQNARIDVVSAICLISWLAVIGFIWFYR